MSWRETRDALSQSPSLWTRFCLSLLARPRLPHRQTLTSLAFWTVHCPWPISLEGSWKQQLSNCLGCQGFVQTLRRKLAEEGSWFRGADPGSEADFEAHDKQFSAWMTFAFYESNDMDWRLDLECGAADSEVPQWRLCTISHDPLGFPDTGV